MAVTTEKILMDGQTYRVRVVFGSRKRHFELVSGRNAGVSQNHVKIRDLQGTGYSYQLQVEPDPAFPEDYDLFYEAISAPVDYHDIRMPYGQGFRTFRFIVTSGDDQDNGILGGKRRWSGLTVNMEYFAPQRRP